MIITLLTDYGHDDDFVGVCHGVIRSIRPETPIVDITHGIPRHSAINRGDAATTLGLTLDTEARLRPR